ncbi:hypothetical protein BJQ89_00481 [Arthrobacter sp. ES1]|nr:hypothetical protein [Arthrobacter sp. ES1]
MSSSASSRLAIVLIPRVPHFVWSASTTTRRAALTKALSVSASRTFGVVNPASASTPWTPRNSTSRCSCLSEEVASGPTSASEGVRSPPVRITVDAEEFWWKTSAIRTELVTTVIRGPGDNSWASAQVVVPALSPTAMPSRTWAAASWAIAIFSSLSCVTFSSKPGSWVLAPPGSLAPPWIFSSTPAVSSASMSRRTVISETPSILARSVTRTIRSRWTSARMAE